MDKVWQELIDAGDDLLAQLDGKRSTRAIETDRLRNALKAVADHPQVVTLDEQTYLSTGRGADGVRILFAIKNLHGPRDESGHFVVMPGSPQGVDGEGMVIRFENEGAIHGMMQALGGWLARDFMEHMFAQSAPKH